MHKAQEAKQRYQEAARYPTAYYGQIARAKAGLGELTLTPFPALSSADRNKAMSSDLVKAAELLYAVDARDLAQTMMADLGDKSSGRKVKGSCGEFAKLVGKRALDKDST